MRPGNLLKSQLELLKLRLEVLKSQLDFLKLQLEVLKSQLDFLKLQLEVLKPRLNILKLELEVLESQPGFVVTGLLCLDGRARSGTSVGQPRQQFGRYPHTLKSGYPIESRKTSNKRQRLET